MSPRRAAQLGLISAVLIIFFSLWALMAGAASARVGLQNSHSRLTSAASGAVAVEMSLNK